MGEKQIRCVISPREKYNSTKLFQARNYCPFIYTRNCKLKCLHKIDNYHIYVSRIQI